VASLLGSSGGVWSVGPGLLQPIFNGGRLRHNLEAARARFETAVAGYRKAALNGYREVANSLVSIQKLAQVREQREASVIALRDAADLARVRGTIQVWRATTRSSEADQQLFEQQVAGGTGQRRRAAGARRPLSRARRWLAAVKALNECRITRPCSDA
jgi:outer membrane protein TolC